MVILENRIDLLLPDVMVVRNQFFARFGQKKSERVGSALYYKWEWAFGK